MSQMELKNTSPIVFKTNGYSVSIAHVFEDVCDVVFVDQSERSRHLSQFAYAFTKTLNEVITCRTVIDRDREITIEVERSDTLITISIFSGDPSEDLFLDKLKNKKAFLTFPLLN